MKESKKETLNTSSGQHGSLHSSIDSEHIHSSYAESSMFHSEYLYACLLTSGVMTFTANKKVKYQNKMNFKRLSNGGYIESKQKNCFAAWPTPHCTSFSQRCCQGRAAKDEKLETNLWFFIFPSVCIIECHHGK
jgi:hypothetical protein